MSRLSLGAFPFSALVLLSVSWPGVAFLSAGDSAGRIRPSEQNPSYWEFQGKTVLLLGGSDDDNLFQWDEPRLVKQLDTLASVGGNVVRNTMSSRDEGNLWPFAQNTDGKYDLDRLNDEYWNRFETFLRHTNARGIVVQIELWDRFDFAREPWEVNPYNPANNDNYTVERSGLRTRYPDHPGSNRNRFFYSVPDLDDNQTVLPYQRAQVEKLLEIALKFPNVLYCMDNETSGHPAWGAYWAALIRDRAREAGVEVHTTEMWDPWDLADPMHRHTLDHPELYTFVDISQNNHQKGQVHWDNMQLQRERIREPKRPMNSVKIYGADTGRYGTDRDGIERFWRLVLGGAASARFHRPDSGLGLSETSQAHLRSGRMLAKAFDVTRATPDRESSLLSHREPNEAYLSCIPGGQYAILFLNAGEVGLDLSQDAGDFELQWLDIAESRWLEAGQVSGNSTVNLKTPGPGRWVAFLRATTRR